MNCMGAKMEEKLSKEQIAARLELQTQDGTPMKLEAQIKLALNLVLEKYTDRFGNENEYSELEEQDEKLDLVEEVLDNILIEIGIKKD